MRKHARLYYVPGMITLLILPLFFMMKIAPLNKQERVMEVAYATNTRPWSDAIDGMRFDTSLLSHPPYIRHYINIKINGDLSHSKDQLMLFKYGIRHLQQTVDTVNGLHLVFGDSTTYETYVACFDICLREEQMRYMPFRNHLWVQVSKNDAFSKKYRRMQLDKMRQQNITDDRINLKKFKLIEVALKDYWPWLLGWLVLVGVWLWRVLTIKRRE